VIGTNTTGVIDVGIGNVGSVLNMLKKIGAPAARITDPEDLAAVDRILLPGVGAFDAAMIKLEAKGFDVTIRERVAAGTPLLGICLGMQLLLDRSEEGDRNGLGVVPGECLRFDAARLGAGLKIPHMGWSEIETKQANPLFEGDQERFYFVHSYHAAVAPADILATCRYGYEFACAIGRGNVYGVQFHPEKSHRFGMALLSRFARVV